MRKYYYKKLLNYLISRVDELKNVSLNKFEFLKTKSKHKNLFWPF